MPRLRVISRVISGGQTGSDRGALDAAIASNIDHGGHCPAGRRAEDGEIPECYQLVETESKDYPPRTALNIKEADATLILSKNSLFDRGTGLTLKLVKDMNKPYVKLNIGTALDSKLADTLCDWLIKLRGIKKRDLIINVAGPRESRLPGLQATVKEFLTNVFKSLEERYEK